MKVQIDREADALYIRLREGAIVESEEVRPGLVLDFDGNGEIVGIEVLDASRHMNPEELASVTVQNLTAAQA